MFWAILVYMIKPGMLHFGRRILPENLTYTKDQIIIIRFSADLSIHMHYKKVDLFQPLFFESLLKFVQINTKYNTRWLFLDLLRNFKINQHITLEISAEKSGGWLLLGILRTFKLSQHITLEISAEKNGGHTGMSFCSKICRFPSTPRKIL